MSDDVTLDEFADTIAEENEEGSRITGLGTFPSGWDVERITRCAEIRDSERIPLNSQEREQKKPGEIPYYGANGVLDYINEYIFDSELILLAEDGGHFEEYQNRPVAYRISGKSWVNNHAHILEAKDDITTDYLFYSLEHRNLVPYVSGSTRSKLTQTMLKKMEVPVPPLSEQRKIATVLHTVDQAIQKTEEIIETHESVLSGLIQDIATTGVGNEDLEAQKVPMLPERWKIPTHWGLEFLEDLSTLITDGAHQTPTYVESGIPFLKVENIKNEEIDWQSVARIPEDEHKELIKRGNPTEGDVLLSKNGTIGISKIVDYDREFSHFVSLALIRPKQDILLSDYLATVLESRICMDQARARSKTGTVTNLHLEEIEKLSIPVPPISEQREILEKISAVRECLNSEESYISRLRRIKQGLMQDLLSGEVRTSDAKIKIPEEVANYG